MKQLGRILVFSLWLCLSGAIWAGEFSPPVKITDGTRKYQMSRTADAVMAIDSAGILHVTYWAGGLATTPGTPSYIFYRSWEGGHGWSDQQAIDDSIYATYHVGGRHPSLALTAEESVWVVWHDHRHCAPIGNWINNTEIYGDLCPKGGSFSATDIRLTNTTADHYGDNSYTPKIVSGPDGRMNLVWYDYHYDFGVPDIFLTTSDAQGIFTPLHDLASARVTQLTERGGSPPFTVPDIAIDPEGTRHLVWAGGTGAGVDLYYTAIPAGTSTGTPIQLAEAATDFFDPPHITTGSNGDVWIFYGDDTVMDEEEITIYLKPVGKTTFETPFTFPLDPSRQYGVDGVADPSGRLHLVWVDEREGTQVRYGIYDPNTNGLTGERILTDSDSYWVRPSIELDTKGNLYVLWEEDLSVSSGEVWFSTTRDPDATAIDSWWEF